MIRMFLVIAFLALPLAGCQKSEHGRSDASRPLLITPVAPSGDAALQQENERFFARTYAQLSETIWFRGDAPLFLQLFAKAKGACHACSADIGGYLAEYDPAGRRWQVVASSYRIAEAGSYGEPPEPLFIKLGPSRYGFLMTPSYMAQGIVVKRARMFAASPAGFREVLDVPLFFDNSGSLEGAENRRIIQVRICQVVEPARELYDLRFEIEREGKSSPDDDYGFKALYGDAKSLRFIFKDGAYLPDI